MDAAGALIRVHALDATSQDGAAAARRLQQQQQQQQRRQQQPADTSTPSAVESLIEETRGEMEAEAAEAKTAEAAAAAGGAAGAAAEEAAAGAADSAARPRPSPASEPSLLDSTLALLKCARDAGEAAVAENAVASLLTCHPSDEVITDAE